MNKIIEIIPDNLPANLQAAMDEGQFFNYVVNSMVEVSKIEEFIKRININILENINDWSSSGRQHVIDDLQKLIDENSNG